MKRNIIIGFILFIKFIVLVNLYYSNQLYNHNHEEDINTQNLNNKKNHDEYNTNKKLLSYNGEPLEVYLIPHSHCDGGWLKTFDEYFEFKVSPILDGILTELNNDIEKKFNWAEIGFFSKWYDKQDQYVKEIVKRLVANKQLEFISGGYVQNDEATANLDDVIEQMTQGHQWLKDTFNITVEYGWQIDPFGYSSLTPTLFSRMGIKGLVINRVSDSIRNYMKNSQQMDFLWKGSETLGQQSELIVSTLNTHYSYPDAIDPSNTYFYQDRARMFSNYLKSMAATRNTNILLITLGDDFRYTSAQYEYSVTDEWLQYMQENLSMFGLKKIGYSTLSEYFEALQNKLIENNQELHLFNKDFFPYSTGVFQYWTGYYSTRPVLKRQIRETSDLLRSAESLYSFAKAQFSSNSIVQNYFNQLQEYLQVSRNEISLAQHHDIVTGTSRNYVLKDNFERLKNARLKSYNVISNSIEYLLNKNQVPISEPFEYQNVVDLNQHDLYSIVFHNSLGWSIKQHVSIRIKANENQIASIKLLDSTSNKAVQIQIIPLGGLNMDCKYQLDEYILFAIVQLPAVGLNTYYLKIDDIGGNNLASTNLNHGSVLESTNSIQFKTKRYTISFKSNGLLSGILDNQTGKFKKVDQYFKQYQTQRGGPYIFNAGPTFNYLDSPSKIIYFDGPLVSQLTIVYNSYNSSGGGVGDDDNDIIDCNEASIVTQRIYKNPNSNQKDPLVTENYLETGYSIIGSMNTEKTIHYKVDSIGNGGGEEFFTDNGLETRKRMHQRTSVTSNYYPTLHYVNIKDQTNNQQFTVYVDRSVGVTCTNGDIEIMFHRTIEFDDQKGIGWASRDTSRSDGKFYFNFDTIDNQKSNEKRLSLQIQHQPIYTTKKITNLPVYQSNYKLKFSPLSKDLPDNIHLQSLKTFSKNRVGLRLFNFNDAQQTLDFNLFNNNNNINSNNNFKINHFKETGLSFMDLNFNYLINEFKPKSDNRFPIKHGESEYNFNSKNNNNHPQLIGSLFTNNNNNNINNNYNNNNNNNINNNNNNNNNNKITINPLEIKSYFIDLINNNNNNDNDNNIKFNPKLIDKSIEDNRYQYDFSIYPVSLASYDDNGKYIIIMNQSKSTTTNYNKIIILYLMELFSILFIYSILIVHLLIKKFY